MAIKLVVDSASDITQTEAESLGITMIPMSITFQDGKEYFDGVTLLPYQFYPLLEQTNEIPKTSQITSIRFKEIFNKLTANGDQVIAIVMSSKLSSTYNSALLAASKFDGSVVVVDSLNASVGEKILCLYALELIKQNKSLADIIEELNTLKHKVNFIAAVDTLKYLERGGRVSGASAAIGTLLSIKPIIEFTKQGKLEVIRKEKGMKKALKSVVDEFPKYGKSEYFDCAIVHTDNMPLALTLQNMLFETHGIKPEIRIMGPVIGAHVGPNAVAFTFISNSERPH